MNLGLTYVVHPPVCVLSVVYYPKLRYMHFETARRLCKLGNCSHTYHHNTFFYHDQHHWISYNIDCDRVMDGNVS